MSISIKITRLSPDAWRLYREFRLEALKNEPQAFATTYRSALQQPNSYWQQRLASAFEGKTSWLLFACQEQRIVGMVGAFLTDEPGIAYIVSMYVTPQERGKGVAKALMQATVEELAKNEDIHTLQLGVNPDQTAAMRLYKRMGFQPVDWRRERYADGLEHEEVIMERGVRERGVTGQSGHD